ncbi:MAG: ABC transporter ATP-binding protein [Desulfobacteraceae bacterium]|nr:MAG: ABC transporter ATP-binding protein [Desulfobacteraceae bacterium]
MMSPIIKTKDLGRDFRKTRAVDGLSLSIESGELFGLVGPDGAGKTTTLRLLAGLLRIDEGEASVLGFDLRERPESVKPHIGYMAQQFSLYGELSVMENLQFFAELFDVASKDMAERTERLLTFAGLTGFKDRRAVNLSGGMQKKLALACTLIHKPDILLLDEPTTGVDPISRREFWSILTELHLRGTTILVTTPYMDEADRCSRVGLMYEGRLVECDSPRNIREKLEGEVIVIQPEDWQEALKTLASADGVREAQTYGASIHLLVDSGKRRLPEIEQSLRRARLQYRSIRIAPARMEEAFISLIRKLEA